MNGRTEQPAGTERGISSGFTRGFLALLTGMTLLTLFFGLIDLNLPRNPLHISGLPLFGVMPWVIAGGQTILIGLYEFSGMVPVSPPAGLQYACLLSVLVSFILGPVLFLSGLRDMAYARASGTLDRRWTASALARQFGGWMSVVVVLTTAAGVPVERSHRSRFQAEQAVQSNKDEIINELNTIALNLREYRILPFGEKGGEGSWSGFAIPGDLAESPQARYRIVRLDSLARIEAVSVPFPTASVQVAISPDGRMEQWSYTGPFE